MIDTSKNTSGTPSTRMSDSSKRINDGLTQRINQLLPLRRFGWTFLLAWIFSLFYMKAVNGYLGASPVILDAFGLVGQTFVVGLPSYIVVLMLIIIIATERKFGPPSAHQSLFWLAPALTAVSTALSFLPIQDFTLAIVVFVAATIMTGIGSSLLWVMWGEYYAQISQSLVEFLAPISAVFAAALVLLISSISGWVAVLLLSLLPLLSGLCFYLSWKDLDSAEQSEVELAPSNSRPLLQPTPKQGAGKVLRSIWRIGFGIFSICFFGALAGSFWIKEDPGSLSYQLILLTSIALTTLVAVIATNSPRSITAFLYRWVGPVVVLAFVAIVFFGSDPGYYLAFGALIVARFAFCLLAQMYFARYTSLGIATAVQAFGFAWLFVHAADALEIIFFRVIKAGISLEAFTVDQVAVLSIGILVVIMAFVLDDKNGLIENTLPHHNQNSLPGEQDTSSREEPISRVDAVARQYGLTPRETEVLGLLAKGRSIPYIRDALFISKGTAITHTKNIYQKLAVHSRQELIDLIDDAEA